MAKNKKTLLIVGIAVLAVLLAVLLAFCGLMGREDASTPGGDMTYTVQVKNASDAPMEGIGVYIYEDDTLTDLVWFDKTDAQGQVSFTAAASDKYVAALGNIPTGYAAEAYYPLTGELTEIVLSAGVMSEEDMKNLTYALGDLMMDFTITDTEGKEYTLSELLKTKKAVVLNFWYTTCEPCKAEFPYLQEAYEKYKDLIEVLAMNPVDTDEAAVAAFKAEMGLTFPVAVVDELWAQIMKLTAYPTTVVIDRFGNITLIHKGSIDSADTFEQIFAYFTSDDYVQKNIESIDEIVTKQEGTEDNPMQTGGGQDLEVTVGAGETYYLELYKITGKVYLTVKGTDFILGYNGKEYTPSNGSVTITITSEGPSTAVKLYITNTGDKEQTYYLYLSSPKGSYANPYSLSLGKFSINTESGNEQGVYGLYTAEKSGTLTVRCLRSSVSRYGFFLYNLRSYAMRNADEDAKVDEDGYITVSVQVKKGDTIQFNVAVARDDSNYIAAGSFEFELILTEGDGEEKGKVELPKTTYTVTVTDQNGKAVSGVTVNLKGEFTYVPAEDASDQETSGTTTEEVNSKDYEIKVDTNLVTDDKGVATSEQVTGPYTATVVVPDGYKLEKTQYELTAEKPSVTVKLQKIKYYNYTVTVVDPAGTPVSGATVMIGSVYGTTNSKGVYTQNLAEDTYTVAVVGGVPADLEVLESAYSFPTGATKLTIKLGYALGTRNNPVRVDAGYDYITTRTLDAGETRYYSVSDVAGTALIVNDADAKVTLGDTVYTADADGVVTVSIPAGTSPALIGVTNSGTAAESYTLQVGYSWGTEHNPVTISEKYDITTRILAKDEQVYYSISGVGGTTLTIEDADAVVTFNGTDYAAVDGVVTVPIPENTETALLTFTNTGTDTQNFNVKLTYPLGHEKNPIVRDSFLSGDTGTAAAGATVCYSLDDVAGTTLTVTGADFAVWNGTEYPAAAGVVTIETGDTASGILAVGNSGTGDKDYTIDYGFAAGTRQNPEKIKDITVNTDRKLSVGDEVGYYYYWQATASGSYTISLIYNKLPARVASTDEGIDVTVSRVGSTEVSRMSESAEKNSAEVQVWEGDIVLIHLEMTTATANKTIRFKQTAVTLGDGPEDTGSSGTVDPTTVYIEANDDHATAEPNEYIEPENVLPEGMLAYTVTVTDYTGKAISGAVVQIKNGSTTVSTGMTDYKGKYTANLEEGNYTVALAFSASGYHYEESTAVLNANAADLTVKVTTALPGSGIDHTNGFTYYPVKLGGTYLTLQADAIKYYAFTPTEQGTYRIEASDSNAVLTYWASVLFPNNATDSTLDHTGNGFSLSIKESNIDPNNPATYLIGITGVTDSILEITRIGDAQFDFTDLPYTTPEYKATVALKEQDFSSQLAAGKKLTFVDLTASTNSVKPVLGSDGYYHLGSANGPILYVQLTYDKSSSTDGVTPPYIHLYDMVGGVGETGTALRYANYDNYYVDGTYIKEDYTTCMLEYGSYAAKNDYGVYPLTYDLMYMIQNGGEYQGWYDLDHPSYVFLDADGNPDTSINLAIAWMFAVCYFK